MGNEGSLPTDEDIEGFEYQARSPPSAYPPGVDPQAYAGANANDPRLQQPTRTNGMAQNVAQSVAGRIKGNPFKRGNNAHNQNSFGIEKDMGQTTLSSYPTPSEMQGDNLAYSMGQASVGVGGQPYPTHPQQYPQQHQQQQIYAQQQYQQQQQQYYHTPGQPPLQQPPPQQQFPQIGRNTRPGQRAGAAILNGMRNLNISSTMNRIGGAVGSGMASPGPIQQKLQQLNQRRKQQQQQQVQNVNEWETRWDEDSDEEDEDEQPDIQQPTQTQQQQQLPIAGADALPTTAMTPPIGPPELDSGFSGAAAALVSPEPQLQQQQQPEQPPAIFQQQQQPLPGAAVAVTPGPPSKPEIPDSAVTDDEVENTVNDDGVEWDTGQSTTPNVEQFMPLLRVLGKGSFGKVRTLLSFFTAKHNYRQIIVF